MLKNLARILVKKKQEERVTYLYVAIIPFWVRVTTIIFCDVADLPPKDGRATLTNA
jgi:hypothetical protein